MKTAQSEAEIGEPLPPASASANADSAADVKDVGHAGEMPQLEAPPSQEGGEATRFLEELSVVWDFFASCETSAPVLDLEFDDGRRGAIGDLPDVAEGLLNCLASYFEFPHTGSLHARATPYNMERPFDLSIWWEGVDGPLVVRFDDGTHLSAQIEPKRPGAPAPPRWEASVSAGIAQRQIETIVSLAQLAEFPAALSQGDRQVAEAILALLSSLTTTPEPPRSVVREVATWLGHKVDVFIEEAVKTGGKAAGLVGVGGAAIALQKHAPTLAERIRQLIELAS